MLSSRDQEYAMRFWDAWQFLLRRLPHDRQAEVLMNPGGFEWLELVRQTTDIALMS
jgi:hypothetical protein